mgnify:FL=1|jgi:hypothetical protein
MNRMNPLHIIILLFALVVFFMFKLNSVKGELKSEGLSYKETLSLASDLTGLRDVYGDKNSVKQSLERVLSQSSLKQAEIQKKITSSGIILSSESMDKVELNSFMSKIFNGSYNITALKIKRLSDKTASFQMEIKW